MSIKGYADAVSTKKTPQSEPIPGTKQVKNNAGGFVFAVDDWGRLDRWLVLGSTEGSYYASERKLTKENAEAVIRCIKADGERAVARIVEVSDQGRAPKNDPAIFALALAMKMGDDVTRQAAYAAVPKVCRIGTHLFQLAHAVKALGGWGRGTKRAFGRWYTEKDPGSLALQVVKYQAREGWSHADVLRQVHPEADDVRTAAVLRYARLGMEGLGERVVERKRPDGVTAQKTYPAVPAEQLPRIIHGFEAAKKAHNAMEIVNLVNEYALPRECIPTQFLNDPNVWAALLHAGKGMGLTALIRNLGKMTSVGLVKPLSGAAKTIVERLNNGEELKRARVHPLNLLVALRTYASGRGVKGSLSWTPVPTVVDALNDAFYKSFKFVEPTGKNHLLALDVSGSMDSQIAGMPISAREASVAMALVTANVEKNYHLVGFTAGSYGWGHRGNAELTSLAISARDRLDRACRYVDGLDFGGTDCALPMLYATKNKLEVDAFYVFTDNETWHGQVHPVQALREYRQKMGRPAKLVVVGMTSSGFSIADPNDGGMLDVVGMDTAAPSVMADFVRG